jgi:hypothetical protein
VARSRPFFEIRHLDSAQVILGQLVARGVHVDTEDPCRVESEDLLLHRARQRRVVVLFDKICGDLKAPKRIDLPLRRPIPNRVRPPQHVVGAEGLDDLTKQMGAGCW